MKHTIDDISLKLSHDCYYEVPSDYDRIYLLLHGYLLDGEFMFNKLKSSLPKGTAVIAPNGPLPVPVKKHHEYKMKYSWYYFDPNKKLYYIHMEAALDYLKQIVAKLVSKDTPMTVIGYSQGGYLAPKLGECFDNVDKIIGLASKFRGELFEYKQSIEYHQIHAQNDLVVDFPEAKVEFDILQSKGNTGKMITLEDSGHRLDDQYLKELIKLI